MFPHCPHHQVANLAGTLRGRDVIYGAVVNGPNGADNFEVIGFPEAPRPARSTGSTVRRVRPPGSRFLDDVRAWPSVRARDRLHLHRDARLRPRGRPLSLARRRGGYRRRRERTRRSTSSPSRPFTASTIAW